jgi:PTH2 family peptidyl-tRNA hydrolase
VIIIRTDLKMSTGKIAVQAAHAAVTGSELAKERNYDWWKKWYEEGQCKIVVTVDSEKKLLDVKEEADSKNLPTDMIKDKGLTEVPPGTTTCLIIGPAPSIIVDKITRNFSLL